MIQRFGTPIENGKCVEVFGQCVGELFPAALRNPVAAGDATEAATAPRLAEMRAILEAAIAAARGAS